MADEYEIRIVRRGNDGTLTFRHGGVNISETCWWDPKVVINAGEYPGYASRMENKLDGLTVDARGKKRREAIWLGKGVPYGKGKGKSNGIFIHKGVDPSWSDGCIVLPEQHVFKIWSEIQPKERPVVTVVVEDQTATRRPADYSCVGGRGRWF